MRELPIIQTTYDFIKWYVPLLNRLPRDHKFALGDRMVASLYETMEKLIEARYAPQKLDILLPLRSKLDILRYQTRLLFDFKLVNITRYENASRQIEEIGKQLSGWIQQQQRKS